MLHSDPDFPVDVGAGVSIGHRAVVHGCTVEDDALVGMGAVVLNGAVVGRGSLVAAGVGGARGDGRAAGLAGRRGARARCKREVTDAERERMRSGAESYVTRARRYREECDGRDVAGRWTACGSSRSASSWPRPSRRMQLADLGADVLKVESPDGGEPVRSTGPFVDGRELAVPAAEPVEALGRARPQDRRRPGGLPAARGRRRRGRGEPAARRDAAARAGYDDVRAVNPARRLRVGVGVRAGPARSPTPRARHHGAGARRSDEHHRQPRTGRRPRSACRCATWSAGCTSRWR